MGWLPFNKNKQHNEEKKAQTQREKTPWELAQEEQKQQQSFTAQATKQTTVQSYEIHDEHVGETSHTAIEIPIAKPISASERIRRRFIMISLALLAWGCYFLSPWAKPQQIVVVGATQTNEVDIVTHSGISLHQTIWSVLLQEKTINNSLAAYSPKIKQAHVALTGVNTIVITIDENPAVAYFEKEDKRYEALANETIVEWEPSELNETIPQLDGFSDEALIKKLASQLALVSPMIVQNIERVSYQSATNNRNGIVLMMKDGMKVIADLTTVGTRLIYYNEIKQEIGTQKGTIDMEVGIFFTPN